METIVSGLISAGAAIIVCVITQITQAKRTSDLIEYKIDELQKRVDKHNNIIERTYKLEESVSLLNQNDMNIDRRLNDLENFHEQWRGQAQA